MSPLQNLTFHDTYDRILQTQQEKLRDLTGQGPRIRNLQASQAHGSRRGLPVLLARLRARLARLRSGYGAVLPDAAPLGDGLGAEHRPARTEVDPGGSARATGTGSSR